MTGYSVIGERPRVALDDIEAFPFCVPARHPDKRSAAGIVVKIAKLMDRVAATPEWQREHAYARVKDELDSLIYEYFLITTTERILVEDTVRYIATSIQPPDYQRLSTPLLHRPVMREIERYVEVLANELSEWRSRDRGQGSLIVRAFVDGARGFFGAVQITTERAHGDRAELVTSERAFATLLEDLGASLATQSKFSSAQLFAIPNIMVLAENSFFFVKPLRRRFWLPRTALTDADHIVKTVHGEAWEQLYS
jgi:hypothetical protein